MPREMPVQPEFPVVRRGFDPESVQNHLRALERHLDQQIAAANDRYTEIDMELEEARKREEAVHLTLVAATKTKEELLVNAQRQAEETLTRSREESEELLSAAKKEAFRLLADARQAAEKEAEKAHAEAEELATQAAAAADATRDAARREAIEIINTVESDTANLVEAREVALANMRRKHEEEEAELASRIEVLRNSAADLEARLRAIASGGLDHAATLVSDLAQEPMAPIHDFEAPPTPAPEPTPVHHAHNGAQLPTEPVSARESEGSVTSTEATEDDIDRALAAAVEQLAQGGIARTESANSAVEVSAEVISESTEMVEKAVAADGAADEAAMPAVADSADIGAVESTEPAEVAAETAEVEPTAEEADSESDPAHEPDTDLEPAAGHEFDTDVESPAAIEPAAEVETAEIREPVAAGVGARVAAARDEEYGSRKGSYYSRRSAKLPRIGTEAGRSALAAANAIRGATRGINHTEDEDTTA